MKKHNGKTMEEQVFRSGLKKMEIAKKLGITRQTLANKFKTPNLPVDFIIKVGRIIGYDFSGDIPEIGELSPRQVNETQAPYLSAKQGEPNWKEKYYALLEEYRQHFLQQENTTSLLVKSINDLKNELKGMRK